MRHDTYKDVHRYKVIVSIAGQATTVHGWVSGEFVAIEAGPGHGWKVHRLHITSAPRPGETNASVELVRGLDRDAAIAIVNDAARDGCTTLEQLQAILRTHLGGFAL